MPVLTATVVAQYAEGNQKVVIWDVNNTAVASGSVSGYIGYVNAAMISPVSMATAAINVAINKLEAATAAVGSVGIKGMTSGDRFYLKIYGRS